MNLETKSAGARRANDPPILILTSLEDPTLADLQRLAKDGVLRRHLVIERGGIRFGIGGDDRRRPYQITSLGSTTLTSAIREMNKVASVGATRLGLIRGQFA